MQKQAIKEVRKAKPVMSMITAPQGSVQSMDRHEMIATGAYLRAEQRGFQGGDPVADWLDAEAEIDRTPTMNA